MDPRRLLTFRAVAHAQSFSRAAEHLSLTQPSVSHQVALLETETGIRLFERGRGGLRLTDAGTVLLAHADDIAWRLELAGKQISQLAAGRRQQFRLGAFPTALAAFVPSAVRRLHTDHEDLRIRLGEVTPSGLEERVLRGDFDVAISYQDASLEKREFRGAERVDLMQDGFLLGLPAGHRLARGRGAIALADLAEEDWIFASTEGFLVQACRDAGFEPHIAATTSEPLATRGLILRGLGVGWVPRLLASDYPDVVTRQVKDAVPCRDVYALLPPGDRHPRARQVVDALLETAAEFT